MAIFVSVFHIRLHKNEADTVCGSPSSSSSSLLLRACQPQKKQRLYRESMLQRPFSFNYNVRILKESERITKIPKKSCKILTLLEETCSFLTKHEAEKEEDDADDEQNRDRGHQGHLEEKEVKICLNVGKIFPDTWFLRVLYLMHFRVVHFSLGWKKLAKVRPSNSMK